MADGVLKKSPSSGSVLLNPLRQRRRCTCCTTCDYAIRAEPCFQELEDCEPTIPPLWLCVNSRCSGSSQTLGDIKTPVVFLYTVPGDVERCYETIPSSVTLVSKLDPEIAADLITSTSLECLEDGCDAAECGSPENTCVCICRSADESGHTICCMSRLVGGVAPWTVDSYTRTIDSYVERENRDGGLLGGGCVSDDCRESRSCDFFHYEEEIDQAELAASYTPIAEQGCTKTFPTRSRVTLQKTGYENGPPTLYACCGEADTGSPTWAPANVISLPPPTIIPHDVTVTDGTPTGEDGCTGNTKTTVTVEGDCTFYQRTQVDELWTYSVEGGVCKCQEYQRITEVLRIEFSAAVDETTLRICHQCDVASGGA